MKNQERIFVIGHKNPDTDSICSAIAYADIKNRTSQKVKYVAKRAGQINEETEYVLNRFGMQPPGYLSNIGTQVKDMDIRMSPEADKSMSLKNAWDLMMEKSIVSLPIRDREGQLEGLITIGDIAKTYMDTTDSYLLSRAKTQYRRIAETIGGTVIEGNEHGYFANGKVMVGTANPEMLKSYVEEDDLIYINVKERRLEIVGVKGEKRTPEEMEEILKARKAKWQPKPPKYTKGTLKLFSEHAVSPIKGGYMV